MARAPDNAYFAYLPHRDFPVPFVTAEIARVLDLQLAEEQRDANE